MRLPALLPAVTLLLLVACAAPTPAPTPTAPPTATATPTPTPTPSPTPAPMATATPPSTPSPTSIPTASPTPTPIPQPAATATPQPTATPEPPYAAAGGRIVTLVHTQWDIVHFNVLRDLARTAPMAFDAVMDWLGDGRQPGRSTKLLLDDYVEFVNADELTAARVISMPFLEEVDYLDQGVVRLLRDIASNDKEALDWILAHPALEGGITDANAGTVFLLDLERENPAAGRMIRNLPWVQDGIAREGWEDDTVSALVEIARRLPMTFQALIGRTWIQDGPTSEEWSMLTAFAGVPLDNNVEAALLVGMPFLDAVDRADARLIRALLGTLPTWPDAVGDIIARPEVESGITDTQRSTVALWVLDLYDPEDAELFSALPWIEDGLQPGEAAAFWTLWDSARLDDAHGLFRRLLNRSWIQDGVSSIEAQVLNGIMTIYAASGDGPDEAAAIVRLPLLDTIESTDVDFLRTLGRQTADERRVFLSHAGAARDVRNPGATFDALDIAGRLRSLERQDPGFAAAVQALPWVQDGVDDSEAGAAEALIVAAQEFPAILDMPFVRSMDSLDVVALISLYALSQEHGLNYLQQVMSHPSLAGGITDEWTSVVAALERVIPRPELFDVLLDPERTHLEERTITLPVTGSVRLSVIRANARAADAARSPTMALLEQAVRSQEEFMGVAFPQNHANVLVADVHRFGGTGGSDAIIVSNYADHRGVIAHEVAHTYWAWGPGWIAEGGASFLDVVSHRAYDGTPLPTQELQCTLFSTLAQLERTELPWGAIFASGCDYFLGRGIFRELYNELGDEAFRRGFGRFYLAVRHDSHGNTCTEDDRYACYLRESFTEGATPEQVAIVEDVLKRRYYG